MNLFNLIQKFLNRNNDAESAEQPEEKPPADLPAAILPVTLKPAVYSAESVQTLISDRLEDVREQAAGAAERFGTDVTDLLYRPGTELFIRQELIPFLHPGGRWNYFLDFDYWTEKCPFNFPGPFYTGVTDNCATGGEEAPANVLYDSEGREYLFRQPRNWEELVCVMSAALVDPFDGYSCDGNLHWTYELCRQWWAGRDSLRHKLADPEVIQNNEGRIRLYTDYLDSDAEKDLRRYCYFLIHGYYPSEEVTDLPPL
jgi:hypothetical protein